VFRGCPKNLPKYRGVVINRNINKQDKISFWKIFIFLAVKNEDSHNPRAIIIAPIQRPEIVSSTPRYLENPMPVPIAIAQSGQIAKALRARKKKEKKIRKKATTTIFI
jgi:hypothetical protein